MSLNLRLSAAPNVNKPVKVGEVGVQTPVYASVPAPQQPVVYENPPPNRINKYYQEVYLIKLPVKVIASVTASCDPCGGYSKGIKYNLLYTDSRHESLYNASIRDDKIKLSFDFGKNKANHVMVKLDYYLDQDLEVLCDEIRGSVFNCDACFSGVATDDGQGFVRVSYQVGDDDDSDSDSDDHHHHRRRR